jgi:tetratricopeptide (TPR) repeat protein
VADVARGQDVTAIRIHFAHELHFGENYAEALAILDHVLKEQPEQPEALTLQADIAVHQEQYDRAEALCERVLAGDGASVDTWMVLTDVYRARRDWARMLESATQGMALVEDDDWEWDRLLGDRARVLLELRDFHELESAIEVLSETRSHSRRLKAASLRAILMLRTGRYQEALDSAVTALTEPARGTFRLPRRELAAVRFEAAHRLGRIDEAGVLDAQDIQHLREAGHEAWMDRLAAEFSLHSA